MQCTTLRHALLLVLLVRELLFDACTPRARAANAAATVCNFFLCACSATAQSCQLIDMAAKGTYSSTMQADTGDFNLRVVLTADRSIYALRDGERLGVNTTRVAIDLVNDAYTFRVSGNCRTAQAAVLFRIVLLPSICFRSIRLQIWALCVLCLPGQHSLSAKYRLCAMPELSSHYCRLITAAFLPVPLLRPLLLLPPPAASHEP